MIYATAIDAHKREILYLEAHGFTDRLADERKRMDATLSVMRAHRKTPSRAVTHSEQAKIWDAWVAAVPPIAIEEVSA